MKRVCSAIAISLIVLSAAGCQKTPDTSIVVGKNNDALIEKAQDYTGAETGSISDRVGLTPETQSSETAAQEQSAGGNNSSASYKYQNTFASTDGSINVTVDAEVIAPEADSAAIIRVTDGSITQAQADVLIDSLVHSTLYDPYAPATKDAIMEQILKAKQQLAAGPSEDDEGMNYSDENGNKITWAEWMQQAIDRLQEQYNNAPEENEQAAISGQFVEEEEWGGMSLIYGTGVSEQYGYESLQIQNNTTSLGASRALYDRNSAVKEGYILLGSSSIQYADVTGRELPGLTISADDARAMTDPLVEKLGIENMAFYAARKGYEQQPERDFWVVLYTRSFNGIPITYTSATGDMMTDATVYNEPWRYETLAFFVNDSGIVGLYWEAPYTIGDTVTSDSALLSFDDVMAVFEKMYLVNNDGLKQTVTINQIRLGYTRIAEQDKDGSGILVPVWDFFGTVTDENGNTKDDPYASLLTVNAIDGSIINRDMGY